MRRWEARASGLLAALLIIVNLGIGQSYPAGDASQIAAGLLSKGLAAEQQGHLNEARGLLEQAVRLDPHSAKAHALLGLTLERQGDLDGALAQMRQARALDPANHDFAYDDALLLLQAHRCSTAIPVLEKLSRESPSSEDVRVNLARAYAATGNLAKLSAIVEQLPPPMLRDAELLQTLASVLARAHASAAVEQLWLRAIKYNPSGPLGYAALAKLWIAQRQPKRAMAALERAPAAARGRPVYVYVVGEAEEALGHYSQARARFEQLVEAAPDNQTAWIRLIECDLRADQLGLARHDAILANRRFPPATVFMYQMAVIDYLDGRNGAAIASLEPVVRRKNTASVRATLLMAVLESATGNYALATDYFKRAQAIGGASNALTAYFYGATLLRLHHPAQAARQFETALRSRPHFALAEYRLGLALSQTGKPLQALAALQDAARDDSNLAEPYYAMAQVERKLGQADAAERDLAEFSARREHANHSDRALFRREPQ